MAVLVFCKRLLLYVHAAVPTHFVADSPGAIAGIVSRENPGLWAGRGALVHGVAGGQDNSGYFSHNSLIRSV
jgi:hypothetical protein